MKTLFNYIMTTAFLVVILLSGFALSDTNKKYREAVTDENGTTQYVVRRGVEYVIDTVFAGSATLLTYQIKEGADYITFSFKTTSIAGGTDSLLILNRALTRLAWIDTPSASALDTCAIRKEDGTTGAWIDWAPDSVYFVRLYTPDWARYQQLYFWCGTTDTIKIESDFVQGSVR